MTWRITQKALDNAIDRLVESSGIDIRTNDCYGYSQLMTNDGYNIDATLGDTKKDLYYQIQFYLNMKSHEKRINGMIKNE